jgi:hypothetical protein
MACGILARPTMASPTAPPRRTASLGALAALVHLSLDALLSPFPWARPPWLRLEDMPEAFRELPFVPAAAAVSVAAAAVGGLIAALSLLAVEPGAPHRGRMLAGLVTGLWLFSALLTWLTWLQTPFLVALPGILLGIPRGLAVGWLLWRLSPRPAASTARQKS